MMIRVVQLLLFCGLTAHAEDWLQWRGPTGDNHAPAGATAPVEWTEESGLAWKAKVPGMGHSSPTVVGPRIYLTTADMADQTQSLVIYDRTTGRLIDQKIAHTGGLPEKIHPNNTHASPTVASDGQRVFALFYNSAGTWVTAYDLYGNQQWQVKVCDFDPQQYQFGFGASPRVVDGLVVIASEYDGPGSGLYALDPATGQMVWVTPRQEKITFATPAVAPLGGSNKLLMYGADSVAMYEARSGQELWRRDGITSRAVCGTMVWDERLGLAFGSGGYPTNFTIAIQLAGDHEVVWDNRVKCYEQSMLLIDGNLYGVSDRGVAYCWRGTDGQELWKERIGGKYSSSPLLVDGKIYVTSEGGTTHVFAANPQQFVRLAENQLGSIGFATPTPVDGRLLHRFGKQEGGRRQEYLVAIGG